MDSVAIVVQYGFVPLSEWVEVGPYILGEAKKEHLPKNRLPTGAVVCAMRFRGDANGLERIGYGLPLGTSDILYIGYSAQLGVEQAQRLYNMRYNHQVTNRNIREGVATVHELLSGGVEIGWRFVSDVEEAKRLSHGLKKAFCDEHGCLPPWNGRR